MIVHEVKEREALDVLRDLLISKVGRERLFPIEFEFKQYIFQITSSAVSYRVRDELGTPSRIFFISESTTIDINFFTKNLEEILNLLNFKVKQLVDKQNKNEKEYYEAVHGLEKKIREIK